MKYFLNRKYITTRNTLLIIIMTLIFIGQLFYIEDSIAKVIDIDESLEHSSTTNKQYTNDFEEKREFTNGQYSGVEQLVNVEEGSETRSDTYDVSKTFNKTKSNTITNYYDAEGNLTDTTYSQDKPNVGNSYTINEDNYSGSIPRVDTTCTDPITITLSDGEYKKVKTSTILVEN
ncbi:hypothetical protein VQL36_20510 [Chengkuizengella sp. SCS-71B]|uniref:hypothetical protein n=1 Tax=Chengkuizengella sp. SCS-71B TaxID=3115290 RepID=UPI0032C2135B